MTYCARCEQRAREQNDPRLRSRLSGDKRRYHHKAGVHCGCSNRSVPATVYGADFGRLIKLLTIREDALGLMTELAIQGDKLHSPVDDEQDPEQQKQSPIALCKRKIEAAVILFGDGRIDKDEYRRRVEQNEREIAHWEVRTTETEKAAFELAMCMDAIEKLAQLWDIGDDEDRQGMARSLFSYIVYNLDSRRIVDFRLKPWADRFLVLRSALYENATDGGNGVIVGLNPRRRRWSRRAFGSYLVHPHKPQHNAFFAFFTRFQSRHILKKRVSSCAKCEIRISLNATRSAKE